MLTSSFALKLLQHNTKYVTDFDFSCILHDPAHRVLKGLNCLFFDNVKTPSLRHSIKQTSTSALVDCCVGDCRCFRLEFEACLCCWWCQVIWFSSPSTTTSSSLLLQWMRPMEFLSYWLQKITPQISWRKLENVCVSLVLNGISVHVCLTRSKRAVSSSILISW